jgi:hypothetical protein
MDLLSATKRVLWLVVFSRSTAVTMMRLLLVVFSRSTEHEARREAEH